MVFQFLLLLFMMFLADFVNRHVGVTLMLPHQHQPNEKSGIVERRYACKIFLDEYSLVFQSITFTNQADLK